ncbi:MAG: alginate lyase family protein, partial [Tannerella sp.]|nr:alginate lyase family protein [Tannerella sp.]
MKMYSTIRPMKRILFCVFILCAVLYSCPSEALEPAMPAGFIHPGILHTQADMEKLYQLVKNETEPAFSSFRLLKMHECAQADYRMKGPFPVIARDGEHRHTKSAMEADFSAAYLNTLMWICTRDGAHARKALEILTEYAGKLEKIPETNDAPLLVGLEGLKIIYSLEVLKYTCKEITEEQLSPVSRMFRKLFIPVMEKFYARPAYTNGNWGPIVSKAYMAAGIYLDNREMYDKAREFYLHAFDNGTIAHYIDGETGQIQESGRDQGHSMLGLGAMATVCEIAWKQGDDLYSALDNRLMKGFEYVARYNLGHDVPFRRWTDITGKYSNWDSISSRGRGKFIPVFEMAYNHYANRKGL